MENKSSKDTVSLSQLIERFKTDQARPPEQRTNYSNKIFWWETNSELDQSKPTQIHANSILQEKCLNLKESISQILSHTSNIQHSNKSLKENKNIQRTYHEPPKIIEKEYSNDDIPTKIDNDPKLNHQQNEKSNDTLNDIISEQHQFNNSIIQSESSKNNKQTSKILSKDFYIQNNEKTEESSINNIQTSKFSTEQISNHQFFNQQKFQKSNIQTYDENKKEQSIYNINDQPLNIYQEFNQKQPLIQTQENHNNYQGPSYTKNSISEEFQNNQIDPISFQPQSHNIINQNNTSMINPPITSNLYPSNSIDSNNFSSLIQNHQQNLLSLAKEAGLSLIDNQSSFSSSLNLEDTPEVNNNLLSFPIDNYNINYDYSYPYPLSNSILNEDEEELLSSSIITDQDIDDLLMKWRKKNQLNHNNNNSNCNYLTFPSYPSNSSSVFGLSDNSCIPSTHSLNSFTPNTYDIPNEFYTPLNISKTSDPIISNDSSLNFKQIQNQTNDILSNIHKQQKKLSSSSITNSSPIDNDLTVISSSFTSPLHSKTSSLSKKWQNQLLQKKQKISLLSTVSPKSPKKQLQTSSSIDTSQSLNDNHNSLKPQSLTPLDLFAQRRFQRLQNMLSKSSR